MKTKRTFALVLFTALTLLTTTQRSWAQSGWGTALSFDGVNDYVQSQQDVVLANRSFSVEAWVQRRTSTTMDMVVSQGGGAYNHCLMFGFHYYAGNQFLFDFYGNGVGSGTADTDTAWHHWAGTYDASTKLRCLYRDGVLIASNTNTAEHYQGSGPLKIGIGPGGEAPNELDGSVDEVRIWGVARSAAEISANMNGRLSGAEPGLLAYWQFDEGTGTVAYDAATNHVNSVLVNGPGWTVSSVPQAPSGWGLALNLDGADDHLLTDQPVSLANTSFTLEAWARRDGTGRDCIVGQGTGQTNRGLFFGFNESNLFGMHFWHNDIYDTNNIYTDSNWHHWAGTYDATTKERRLYRDGVLLATNTSTADYLGTGQLVVGSFPNRTDWNLDGAVDEVRIWTKVRSQGEIQACMGHPLTGFEPGLATYYRLDRSEGIVAYDATPNHRNGTLVNRPVPVPSTVPPLPVITLFGDSRMTNEYHVPFTDPGATAGAGAVGIAAGRGLNFALRADGSVVGWGQYGDVSSAITGVVALAAGEDFGLALATNGSAIGWGDPGFGRCIPPPAATNGVVAVAAGSDHSLALKSNGSVIAWGDNYYGQTTVPSSAGSGVVAIAVGYYHSLALKADGSVVGWGDNTYGQTNTPASAQSGVVAIAGGETHSLALKADGSVVAWGDNRAGQTDVPPSATNGVVAIAAGGVSGSYYSYGWSVALKADGSVIAWGDNTYGQTNIPAHSASGIMAIAAGNLYGLALTADGSAVAWGLGADRNGSPNYNPNAVPPMQRTLCPGLSVSGTVNVEVPGDYTLTYRVTNALGVVGTAKRIVTVVPDTTPPTLPAQWVLTLPTNSCRVALTTITATDSSDPSPGVTSIPPVGTLLPMGRTNIVCVATDASGNSRTGAVEVIVLQPDQQVWATGNYWKPRLAVSGALAVASSADGLRILVVEQGGQIYTSPDGGLTWTPRESNRYWRSAASSADGTRLVAVDSYGDGDGGLIYTSTDAGATWTPHGTNRYWQSVASSADGSKLIAADSGDPDLGTGGAIYTSSDSGTNWAATSAPITNWSSVASSANGNVLIATGPAVCISLDSGQTWNTSDPGSGPVSTSYESAACSATGSRILVVEKIPGSVGIGRFSSTNFGSTWTFLPGPADRVAISGDGVTLVWGQRLNEITTFYDNGDPLNFPRRGHLEGLMGGLWENWSSIASSMDGNRLVAATYDGKLFTSDPSVEPPLSAPAFIGATNQEVALSGPSGAVVTFSVTATGTSDCVPTEPVTCMPASGSYFPAGTNVVTCFAVDPFGSANVTTFTVVVRGTLAPTNIALSNWTLPESQPVGTPVGTLTAFDPEPGDRHSFALVAGDGDADNTTYAIVGNKLQTAAVLNYEYRNAHSIRVRATDSGDLSVERTFAITVTDVNDAPVLSVAKVTALDAIGIRAGAPAGPVGTAVTNLVEIGGPQSNVTDDDPGAVTGVAIIGALDYAGTWYYTTNHGTNWNPLATPSESSARLLAATPDNRVYFQPATNFIGTVPGALAFRAWDQSSGSNGGTADTTSNGWTTAFSTAVGVADQEVGWGWALKFDGTNDYVNVGHSTNLDVGNTLTIEAWVKPTNLAGRHGVFSTRLADRPGSFQLEVGIGNGGSNRVAVSGPSTWVAQTTNNAIQPNRWTHIAYTRTGANTQAIYVNGVAQTLTTAPYTFTNNTTDKVIGSGTAGVQLFPGVIDEVRIWKVARTQAEISNNLLTTLSGNEPGLVAYYRFDEGEGSTAYDVTTTHADGWLTNGPTWVRSTVPKTLTATNYVLGDTRFVQGYQPNGVRTNATVAVPNLVVSDLSGNIQPGSGLAGVQLAGVQATVSDPAVNVRVSFEGGDWGIITSGGNAPGILATSQSAEGRHGRDAWAFDYSTSPGGAGGAAGSVSVARRGDIATSGTNAPGILAQSQGGKGGNGGNGAGTPASGAWGGAGGAGGRIVVQDNGGNISTLGNNSHGISALSLGGVGGWGGDSGTTSTGHGGHGGTGGNGGLVSVAGSGKIDTAGDNSSGILAVSQAGKGGHGGEGKASARGGDGGAGGSGDGALVEGTWTITTRGTNAPGISANSYGGGGGASESGGWITGGGGTGGGSGDGSVVSVGFRGSIETFGKDSHGLFAQSVGGFAGDGGSGGSIFSSSGGDGGSAGNGSWVWIVNNGTVKTHGQGANALFAESIGGGGGSSGSGSGLFGGGAGNAHAGGHGGIVTVTNRGEAYTDGPNSRGILAQSVGGGGGNAGYSHGPFAAIGGDGGQGGIGNTVRVMNSGRIGTEGADSSAIFAQSIGGGGGTGGGSSSVGLWGSIAIGGSGGGGGAASGVYVTNSAQSVITTAGDRSDGIFAQSVGGGGGNGGFAGAAAAGAYAAAVAIGGTGGEGGNGSTVVVNSQSAVSTSGRDAHGILAQSVGGGGGSGGYSVALGAGGIASAALSLGGSGKSGGHGGTVDVSAGGQIQTIGERSYGIFAQSVGGGGGDGGLSFAGAAAGTLAAPLSFGGSGAGGGLGGSTFVSSQSRITTAGDDSHGIFAQSVGGGGGSGGFSVSGAIGGATLGAAFGGSGGGGASAGNVHVSKTWEPISTTGNRAYGILAQSIGGGGGDGGFSAAGAISGVASVNLGMGGSGGEGGVAGSVTVADYSSITTLGTDSHAIFAQSVGGGGGSGGFSAAAGISGSTSVSATMGGTGGSGANAGSVNLTAGGPAVQTHGDRSYGLLAQSIGGGGGDGGFNVAGNISGDASVSLGLGGAAGVGGNGAGVAVNSGTAINTTGNDAHGIFAQSVGGGGGSGGFSVVGNISGGTAVGANLGGGAGGGGTAGNISVYAGQTINTAGDRSYGILAQSIGGGGGDGGFSVAGGISGGPAINLGMGGSGGVGGVAGSVNVVAASSITTTGANSHAVFAQSVGGGGGSGGFSVAGGISGGTAVSAAIGGIGGSGADARNVTVTTTGTVIETSGDRSYGLLAQSVGGGGGDGGFSVAGGISSGPSVNFGMGGTGGVAGDGAIVAAINRSAIVTHGQDAHGIFVQSVGGGGGSGGFSVAGGISSGAAVNAALGGGGGGGGRAASVTLQTTNTITTAGDHAYGILAQSVGGGGGDGGFSVAGGISSSPTVNFGLGGKGGPGGAGGTVAIDSDSSITTSGTNAHGIFAQSVGGGGGSGGFSAAGGLSMKAAMSAAIGGDGGGGASASNVTVSSKGTINTSGDHSYGILAQSVGGGGGDGGFSFAGAVAKGPALAFALGGDGSTGGVGRAVSVLNAGEITTSGAQAHGVFAQSVGGGGGSGGFSGNLAFDASALLTNNSKNVSLGASLGGSGGGGGAADAVAVTNTGAIITLSNASHGIMAQSVGGGGGAGGSSLSLMSPFGTDGTKSVDVHAAIGGDGGVGGSGSNVMVRNEGLIETSGKNSYGISAQSIGGGGGDGGDVEVRTVTLDDIGLASRGPRSGGTTNKESKSFTVDVTIGAGGAGGAAGDGGKVGVTNSGSIHTRADKAHGIFAQSIGGGGGTGGASATDVGGGSGDTSVTVNFGIGGKGGAGGAADTVIVDNHGTVKTEGNASHGIVAQSVGGGGGVGGASVSTTSAGGSDGVSVNLTAAIGGQGGVAGDGRNVLVFTEGLIDTAGEGSFGVLAQSIGGGGGDGGNAQVTAGAADEEEPAEDPPGGGDTNAPSKSISVDLNIGAGGLGAAGGQGGSVVVTNLGEIMTRSNRSHAIYAQSIGGGGGTGGTSVTDSGAGTGDLAISATLSLGGKGGGGGSADGVTVGNQSKITTLGDASHGIVAQSIGGGGGTGGASISAKGGASGDNNTVSLTATIGGAGAVAGHGGNVLVENAGQMATAGRGSYGILAQSVGGGGGDGGNAQIKGSDEEGPSPDPSGGSDTNSSWSVDVGVGLGGTAGGGGAGRRVDVINSGSITTSNAQSHAIFAQSIGGGGGVGGASATEVGSSGADTSVTVTVGLGGTGGAGGAANIVSVDNRNTVTTLDDASHGIVAQSIGGGGGMGGASVTTPATAGSDATVNLSATIGGRGGVGGSGSNVVIHSEGRISTSGQASYGLLAQSIGGGGGSGGSSQGPDSTSENWSLNLALGGGGGAGGKGGVVVITNVGAIATQGNDSHGALVQSIGGGGGNAGSAHSGEAQSWKNLNITVGAQGGTGNHGGAVTLANTGSITTHGDGSMGVLAQSIGGGGGVGSTAGMGESGRVGIGGSGGAAGDGSTVRVVQDGAIETHGVGAQGIFAQSVGGGGGLAGNVDRGLSDLDNAGLGFGLAQDGGSAGNGGVVTVESAGDITTSGTAANGIFAQSVGGGGGLAGSVGPGITLDFAGSVGGAGDGGAVSVQHDGDVFTQGDAAHGIFAQSVGGTNGRGGSVSIEVTGDITAEGKDSVGIFAQSTGDDGGGNITINIHTNSTVHGGSGASAGVRIEDGAVNALNNYGTITTLNGTTGVAIRGGSGNETVENYGTLIGQVDLGGGVNVWNNHPGSIFSVQSSFALGAGNTMNNYGLLRGSGRIIGNVMNAGTIAPGNSAGSLIIDGSLNLTELTKMTLEIGGRQQGTSYDCVKVKDGVQFDGTLSLALTDNFRPNASDSFTLMEFASLVGMFSNAHDGTRVNTADNLASFEINYTGTNLVASAYASPDTDGDGMADYDEYLAGTDWTNRTSVLMIKSLTQATSGHLVLQFAGVTNKNYVIEYSTNLSNGGWWEVPTPVLTFPATNTVEWLDDGSQTGGKTSTARFYRIRVQFE